MNSLNAFLALPRTAPGASVPDSLQEVELRILNFDVCLNGYRNSKNYISKMSADAMVCAGRVHGGVDTCNVSS